MAAINAAQSFVEPERQQPRTSFGLTPICPAEVMIARYATYETISALLRTSGNDRREHLIQVLLAVHSSANPMALLARCAKEFATTQHRVVVEQTVAERARAHIDDHLDWAVTMKRVAASIRVQESVLAKAFRAEYGKSLRQYLIEARARKAIALIQSGMKVEAAASEVGYRSRKNLYNAIRKFTSRTPASLRVPSGPPT